MDPSSTTGSAPPDDFRPVDPTQRIATLDVVRGAAILGILFVNIEPFSFPEGFNRHYEEMFAGLGDQVVRWATRILVEGKIYTLFSLLFGLGAAVQAERAASRGRSFGALFCRRLLALLAIGVLHDVLLWNGRILIAYAVLGFLIIPFVRRRPRTLLIWAGSLLLLPLLAMPVVSLAMRPGQQPSAPETAVEEPAPPDRDDDRREEMLTEIRRFREGAYTGMLEARLRSLALALRSTLMFSTYMLAAFLLGIWTWKTRVFQQPERHLRLVRGVLLWGLAVGIAGQLAFFLPRAFVERSPSPAVIAIMIAGFVFGNPALCMAYAAGLVLLLRRSAVRRLTFPLQAAGRLTLSNYVLQSVLCTTVFYSYGLGLYGRTGPLANLGIVLAVFVIQLAASVWWARRFRYGPMEWVWRLATYASAPRMRR